MDAAASRSAQPTMRILIFHGYLLRGTGSNIYNANLCRALAGLGHEVHLLCQERHADALGLPPGVHVHVPDIGRVLPVYVADEYEGFDAVPYPELDEAALQHYLDANVAAVRGVVEQVRPEVALANHLVMGPVILARALEGRVPYAVKVHGSALEYTVRPHPRRFLPYALEGVQGASAVLVGSRHTAESLWEVLAQAEGLPQRTRLGPPGVDVHAFRPRAPVEAAERLHGLAERLEGGEAAAWGGEEGAAAALRTLDPRQDRIVSYVGKLIVSKGVDLLLAAWPLVVARVPDARLAIVGFGTYREALGRMVDALARADVAELREIAARGRELEGGPTGALRFLGGFVEQLATDRPLEWPAGEAQPGTDPPRGTWSAEDWLRAAPAAAARVHFTGRLEHEDLPDLLPSCEAQLMPSTFPEAFGMVAAEAAACGALPLSAGHSGMAEVTATLAPAVEESLRDLLSFRVGPDAVLEIATKLVRWLDLEAPRRERARAALAAAAAARYSWESVAQGVLAAAQGQLDDLPLPSSLASG
jgi:glycosyltransferase involved in cell wall biosynthesis